MKYLTPLPDLKGVEGNPGMHDLVLSSRKMTGHRTGAVIHRSTRTLYGDVVIVLFSPCNSASNAASFSMTRKADTL
jgi:hypothetical protein